ncbi:MAG: amidohydrolase [Rhodospirillaceae bacterium]|jgi:predicted amidohydrolase YtcJ|nr:amidohydrolase [Rhodospirillaceae bacterium]MBT5458395.1 amidohydrolase [Rhodospirillaceae bacterium]
MSVSALSPDMILTNGTILTADAKNSQAEAVAIYNGRIGAVGSTSDIDGLADRRTKLIDLKGRTVLPGLTDPHVHFADGGASMMNRTDCRDFYSNVRSIPQIMEKIREQANSQAPGSWVVAHGSPMQDFRMPEGRFPNRHELDEASPNNPVSINFGAHITIANSKALELADIKNNTAAPAGGAIELDGSGELTGKLVERAQYLVRAAIPEYSYDQMKAGILYSAERCLSRGITNIHDIVTNHESIRAYQELVADENLPIRVSLLIRVIEAAIQKESLLNLGIMTGFGNDWLRIGGVKMSIDGGITGHVAKFYEPYVDDPCHEGLIRIEQDELDDTIAAYHKAGHRVCIHAIGDVAMDMALKSLEQALKDNPRDDHRHRVEHLGNWLVNDERLALIKRTGVLPVPNIPFMHYIWDSLLACIGEERLEGSFNIRDMLDAGLQITSGSDGPAYWPLDSLRDLGTCVARKTWTGTTVGADQAISVDEAIRMFTINAAYNAFEEKIKGSIETGKLADFAILAESPHEVEPERIKDIPVDMTICNGDIAFFRQGAEGLSA